MTSRIRLALFAVSLAAAVRAAEPRVEVQLGFAGHVREATSSPVRILVDNSGAADQLAVRFREVGFFENAIQEWDLEVEAPAGARRVEHFVLRTAVDGPSRLEWSLEGRQWQQLAAPSSLPRSEGVLAVVVTSRGGELPPLAAALNPSGQGRADLAAMEPDEIPILPAAWAAVDIVLVDAEATPRIREAAWQALSDAALLGVIVIVHGPEAHVGPPDLIAGRPTGELATLSAGGGPAGSVIELSPDAVHLAVAGEPVTWAAWRSHGSGRVVAAGLNLHDVGAGPGPWLDLIGATPTSLDTALAVRRAARDGVRSDALGRRGWSARALMTLGLGFAALAVAGAIGAWRLTRAGPARESAWYLLPAGCALLALPVLLVGMVDRALGERVPAVIVEECFQDAARSRVTTYLGPFGDKFVPDLDLPAWPAWLETDSMQATGAGRFVVRRQPRAVGFGASFGDSVAFASESWRDAPPYFELSADGAAVRNVSDVDFDVVALVGGGRVVQAGPLRAGQEAGGARASDERLAGAQRAVSLVAQRLQDLPGRFVVGVTRGDSAGLLWTPSARLVIARIPEAAP